MSFAALSIPAARHETAAARQALSQRLGLKDNLEIQDWERQHQDFSRIADWLEAYRSSSLGEDERFLLMELILASACDGTPAFNPPVTSTAPTSVGLDALSQKKSWSKNLLNIFLRNARISTLL